MVMTATQPDLLPVPVRACETLAGARLTVDLICKSLEEPLCTVLSEDLALGFLEEATAYPADWRWSRMCRDLYHEASYFLSKDNQTALQATTVALRAATQRVRRLEIQALRRPSYPQ